MSEKQSTKPPAGTRDFLPDEIRRRQYVIDVIRDVYEKYGFEPLETPAFENIETLLGKYGDEGNKLIFKILKRGEHEHTGEADLALRYDLTVPLARVVAQYQNEIPKFFKRYQIQPVWRADRPAKGRFREFYQCDIDSLGSTSPVVEVELLAAVSDVLIKLGFDNFIIRLNHRQLLTALLESIGITGSRQPDALVALDKFDKVGREGVIRDLEARGFGSDIAVQCADRFYSDPQHLAAISSGAVAAAANMARLSHLQKIVPAASATLDALQQITDLCADTAAATRIRIDPTLARGLSYYTGAIMEIAVPDLAGSLGGGGRYDSLVGMFLGRDVPACGFSLGLERIIVVMAERNMFPAAVAGSPVDILVTIWNEEARADAITLAAELRQGGLRVDVYPEADKLGKQFKYAASRSVPFVAIIGDDERARGEVAVKDLRSGEQTAMPRAEAAPFIARTLNREP